MPLMLSIIRCYSQLLYQCLRERLKFLKSMLLFGKIRSFSKLKCLVDRLQVDNVADKIRVDYADIFQKSEDAESLNLSPLDLSEILLFCGMFHFCLPTRIRSTKV